MNADGSILSVENLSCSYRPGIPVLSKVSLSVGAGEFLGLVGESGCGKSTLGKAVLGLIPFEGSVMVDGIACSKKGGGQRKDFYRSVQAVFQDPLAALDGRRTVGATLEEPLIIHRRGSKAERLRQVDEMLDMVGLDADYKARYPAELSGGQRQRVCIAASLMLRPKLVIADEAVSSLDVSVGAQILNLWQELHERLGLSLLFISHNLNVVYYLCSRIAVMYHGSIVEQGTAEEVYTRPQHPYTKLLLASCRIL